MHQKSVQKSRFSAHLLLIFARTGCIILQKLISTCKGNPRNEQRTDHMGDDMRLCRVYGCCRLCRQQTLQKHGRIHRRRQKCRGVDVGVFLWHRVFFRCDVYRICRRYGLEVRSLGCSARDRECNTRFMACLEGTCPPHPRSDPRKRDPIDAAAFRKAIRLARDAAFFRNSHICVSYPLLRLRV